MILKGSCSLFCTGLHLEVEQQAWPDDALNGSEGGGGPNAGNMKVASEAAERKEGVITVMSKRLQDGFKNMLQFATAEIILLQT